MHFIEKCHTFVASKQMYLKQLTSHILKYLTEMEDWFELLSNKMEIDSLQGMGKWSRPSLLRNKVC